MILALFVYNFSIFFSCFSAHQARRLPRKKYWGFLTVVPLLAMSLLIGFRYGVGQDYFTYQEMFDNGWATTDPLFDLLFSTLKANGADSSLGFFLVALLQFFFFYFAFRDKQELLSWGIFFLFVGQLVFFLINGIRQGVAITAVLCAGSLLYRRKLVAFWLVLFIATLFHKSAAICLLLPLFFRDKSSVLDRLWVQIFLFIIIYLFNFQIYSLPLELYKFAIENISVLSLFPKLSIAATTVNSGLGVELRHFTYFLTIFLAWRYFKDTPEGRPFYRLFYFGMLFEMIAGFDMNMSRIALFFTSFHIIFYAIIANWVFGSWKRLAWIYKALFATTLVSLVALYFASIFSGVNCSPYEFVTF